VWISQTTRSRSTRGPRQVLFPAYSHMPAGIGKPA
jgi:hypothetical protein